MTLYHVRVSVDGERGDETKLDLTLEQLMERFIGPYRRGQPITINGRTVAMDKVARIRVSSSERSAREFIPGLKERDRTSSVAVLGGPSYSWRAAAAATNVTDEFIDGPPGSELNEPSPRADGTTFTFPNSEPGIVPIEIATLIGRALEPLERQVRLLEDESDVRPEHLARASACLDIMRLELKSNRPDAVTMLRQLQLLVELDEPASTSPLADVRAALLSIGTPQTASDADRAAEVLDAAAAKVDPERDLEQSLDSSRVEEAKSAFAESYGGTLGKWAATVTVGAVVVIAGAASGAAPEVAGRAFELARWLIEVLRHALP